MKRDNVTKWTLILRAAFAIGSLCLSIALPATAVTAATPSRFLFVPLNELPGGDYEPDFPFALTPDERTVVYSQGNELFSIPVSGGTPRHLATCVDRKFRISADGRLVVCARFVMAVPTDANQYSTDHYELVSMPVNGGKPNVLATFAPRIDAAWVDLEGMSPDSKWIAYATEGRIYVAPLSGGETETVAAMKTTGGGTPDALVRFSPDSGTLLYLQSLDLSSSGGTLFTVPRTGGTPVQLVGPKDLPAIYDYRFAPDSSRIIVVFWDEGWASNGLFEIYSFPKEGGEGVRLSASHERYLEEASMRFEFLPDGAHLVYASWDDAEKRHKLITVAVDGSERAVLVTADGPAQLLHLERSAGAGTLLYSVLGSQGKAFYSTPIADGAPVQLTPPFSNLYGQIQVDASGSLAVLVGEDWNGFSSTYSVYVVPVGGGEMRLLARSEGPIARLGLSSDGSRAFYEVATTGVKLYRVPTSGGDPEYMGLDDAREFRVVEAGERVLVQTSSGFYALVEASEAHFLPLMQY